MIVTRSPYWVLAVGVACCLAGAIWSAASSSRVLPGAEDALEGGDRLAITKVLLSQQDAWNRGDLDAFLEGYWHSPELSFSGAAGTTRGFALVRERYRAKYEDRAAMGQLEFSELEFRGLGPRAALVLGHWHLKREKGDVGGVFTLILERFPEGWRIIHDHTSAFA
jgi:ketosteroid isomerase-like protein